MGRMINVFELSVDMGGTKLLTDKAHRDGSPSRRNRPDVSKKSVDHGVVRAEDKQITSELRNRSSTKKSGGMPMKMLIAREMSKETEYKRKQPNVVARLMGLDEALPVHQSVVNGEGQLERSALFSRVTLAGALQNSRQLEDGYFDRSLPCEVHSFGCEEYRDVYEVWQQPPRTTHFKDQSLPKGRYIETQNERRMALVRQKFAEAKRLATDEKLLQSKEFQDALEVLSSNRDLFLKFLEEPNSLFSCHLKEVHSAPAAPQTQRITVLKPSRTVDTKGDTQIKKQQCPTTNEGGWNRDKPQRSSSMTQPTRIVVLKPSHEKCRDPKPIFMPHVSLPELMEIGNFDQVLETTKPMGSREAARDITSKPMGSREAARDITRQMRETVGSNRRDESLLSSVLSNGYVGDESSFNRSENEYEGEDGNFSDAEIPSPTSRNSWDYSNRFGSPCSLSSFSRASYSPEPLVIRDAKKRLSERWSLVASNGNSQEQMEMPRSSNTLGKMLAISEAKKEEVRVGGLTVSSSRSYGGEEDLRVSSSSSSTCQTKNGDGVERSRWNLSRSKSLPVSSAFENGGLNSEVSNSVVKKPVTAKDTAKSKRGKSSFKGKVSSLFFSRNKKGGREKSIPSPAVGSRDVDKGGSAEPVDKGNNDLLHPVSNNQPEGCPQVNCEEGSIKVSSHAVAKGASKQGTLSFRDVLFLEKPNASQSLRNDQSKGSSHKFGENQNQPSPTSVLDAPFEDDTTNSTPDSSGISTAGHSAAPIASVARTLSWDDTNLEISSLDTSNFATPLCKANAVEQQRHLFVRSILSTAGLDRNSVFSRWHSVDCPLDPTMLDKFLDRREEDAKSRERRSNQRLMFDCINDALLEIGRVTYLGACPWAIAYSHNTRKKASAGSSPIGDEVWVLICDWFAGEGNLGFSETDNSGLVVGRLLRREVGGSGWAESMQSEIEEISKEIGGKVLDELVAEALADLTVGCLL